MRLVWKLTAALVAGMCTVLGAYGYLRVQQDLQRIEADLRKHQALMGRVLGAAVATVWRSSGEQAALHVLDDANQKEREIAIRWIWLDALPGSPHAPQVPASELRSAAAGQKISLIREDPESGASFYTYVPVSVPEGPVPGSRPAPDGSYRGAIELSQSLTQEAQQVRPAVLWVFFRMGLILAVCGLISMALGVFFVGRPVRSLIQQARRVGAGDLSGRLEFRQHDELGALASEMNGMCERLAEAQRKLASETAARIAALEQLRHAERLSTVGKLSSGIAHELGTPLNVAMARTKLIASSVVSGPEAAENAGIAFAQLERITKIIRQLMDFARRGNPRKELKDLRQVLQQSAALMRTIADKHGVALELQAGKEPALARVDAGQMQQALANLILNAIQACSQPGSVRLAISSVEATPPAGHEGRAGRYLRLDVADDGAGMPPEILERVFEPFFTTKDVGEGTGLGLSVSYGIVVEHGGWIDARSEVGRGSRFSIYLPQEPSP